MNKKIIRLSRGNPNWKATFENNAQILDLFDTDTLPTAWLSDTDGEIVRADIQKRNPEFTVLIDGTE